MLSVERIIQTICPDLWDAEDVRDFYIQIARESTSTTWYGPMTNLAIAYYACHLYSVMATSTLADIGGGASSGGSEALQTISSISEGSLSISYATSSSSSDSGGDAAGTLSATRYGKMLEALRKTRLVINVAGNGASDAAAARVMGGVV